MLGEEALNVGHSLRSGEQLHRVDHPDDRVVGEPIVGQLPVEAHRTCLLYTSDAADERSSVDLGGRRTINKNNIVALYWEL